LKNVFLDNVKKGNTQGTGYGNTGEQTGPRKKKTDEVDMSDFKIPEAEVLLVDSFLSCFTIVSESSLNEHLDIMLMLKALPNRINHHTLE
jgi:hypothetical protein